MKILKITENLFHDERLRFGSNNIVCVFSAMNNVAVV